MNNKLPTTMEGYHAETDPPEIHVTEFLKIPNITAGTKAMTMKEFPALGELPFTKDTPAYLVSQAYFLASFGCNMQLDKCNLETLKIILNEYDQKPIDALKKKMAKDLQNNQIMILYRVWPVVLAASLHQATMAASISLRRIDHGNRRKGQKNLDKEAVTDVLLQNLMALSTLFFTSAEMVKIASAQWGIDPYYINRKIKHSKLEEIDFTENPPETPLRQVTARSYKTWQNSQNSLRCDTEQHDQAPVSLRAIFKDKQKLHEIIKPN